MLWSRPDILFIIFPCLFTDLGRKAGLEISSFHMANNSRLDFGVILVPSTEKVFWRKFILGDTGQMSLGREHFRLRL